MKNLTQENIKEGLKVKNLSNPTWGEWTIGKDENGWTINGRSGVKMLLESEFKNWGLV